MSHFNYIITCHNSEALIEQVLHGISPCCRAVDNLIVVLDGCSDCTEPIVDTVGALLALPVQKVYTPDVHELLSINAGLRAAPQDGHGFNIILQDDVILECPDLEAQVEKLYETIPNLGYVSFRLGFNLGTPLLSPGGFFNQPDEIESAYGAGITEQFLMPGIFAYRTVPVKSPVCLPYKLVREVGTFNEELAPYAYDDLDLAIRTSMAGYHNGVYSIPFRSDVRWGGSRRPGHPDIMPTALRNAKYIAAHYATDLAVLTSPRVTQPTRQMRIVDVTAEQNEAAKERWAQSKQVLAEMSK